MKIYIGKTIPLFFPGVLLFIVLILSSLQPTFSQETNTNVSGIIKSEKNELLAGAIVKVIHQPTENTYINISRNDGSFNIFNLKPGGPYSVTISFNGYETITKKNLSLGFNSSNYFFEPSNHEVIDFILQEKQTLLKEVIVQAPLKIQSKSGIETSIFSQQLASLPTISRNLQDFIRLVPQSKVNGDGMLSLAGQNSKFNAFFIDGANNNDILGIAQSGTNGGQTATPPISIEALEEIKVLLAPYNTEYSNFTGGSINAITKSGSNELKNSVWYYFRNENMAGKSPLLIENPASPGIFSRPKFSPFFNQTFGTWVSGPIVKNKLFFFISIEKQLEERPQSFNFSEYRGTSNAGQILALADTLRKRYNYDPGTFLETTEKVNAIRTVFKADWNPSLKDKFTVSYRYNLPERTSLRATGSTVLAFQNNGFIVPARTHSVSAEWKHFFKQGTSNRFLFTYTNQKDDRQIL
ncbi:MAG: carboxypeptidase regulatory-like domain-containing protein, partial [Chitinophagaceae bacterium]